MFKHKKVEKPKRTDPLKLLFQAISVGLVGVVTYFSGLFDAPKPVQPVAVSASKLEMDMSNALEGKSLKDHETLYIVFKGVSEYAKNAVAINTTVDVYNAIDAVITTYDVKSKFSSIADVVDSELSPLKTPAKFADKRNEVIDIFDRLADAVKYSAEHIKK